MMGPPGDQSVGSSVPDEGSPWDRCPLAEPIHDGLDVGSWVSPSCVEDKHPKV